MIEVAVKIDTTITREEIIGAILFESYRSGWGAYKNTLESLSYIEVIRLTKQHLIQHGRDALKNASANIDKGSIVYLTINKKLTRLFS